MIEEILEEIKKKITPRPRSSIIKFCVYVYGCVCMYVCICMRLHVGWECNTAGVRRVLDPERLGGGRERHGEDGRDVWRPGEK